MQKLLKLAELCRQSDLFLPLVVARHLRSRLAGKNILAADRVIIKGLANIDTAGLLEIGMRYVGFMHRFDRTYLNVRGRLKFNGHFSIGKGCRIDVGPQATAEFGTGYVNARTIFSITHGITVGDGCAIAWGCQFLDENFHQLTYPGKTEKSPSIVIGRHVWIGSNVTVLSGSRIADGCVVASAAVISSAFDRPRCLIAGNPARVIREDVEWI